MHSLKSRLSTLTAGCCLGFSLLVANTAKSHEVPPDCEDRFTGGGIISLTPSGGKGTFGAHGGIHNGEFWGGLNYVDHNTGLHVQGTQVTAYVVLDENCRRTTYTGTANGQAATIVVDICDNGEPGRNDLFRIQVSNGYTAGGNLSNGGNIQLHKPKCN